MTDSTALRRPGPLLVVLSLLTAVAPLAIDMYVPGFPELGREPAASGSAVQLSMSVFLVGLVAGQLMIGPLSDRLGRRRLLVPGAAAFAILSACCTLAPTVPLLVAGRFLQGCAGAAGLALARAVLTDRFAGPRLPVYFSILAMILGVAPVLGPLLGGVTVSASGWRTVFCALTVFGLVSLAATWLGVPESLPPERRSPGGLRQEDPDRGGHTRTGAGRPGQDDARDGSRGDHARVGGGLRGRPRDLRHRRKAHRTARTDLRRMGAGPRRRLPLTTSGQETQDFRCFPGRQLPFGGQFPHARTG
ncbi:hypothetical protein GCM10022224_090460 [Nonomuraea antimicrobica]|uniref:Major facilitator superfamily (MFS) profile domain-containing protein n=1 Tax=Nonomuraea antimicrobica TaxID=561173 RepID=A0ABP7DZ92_9ACTN